MRIRGFLALLLLAGLLAFGLWSTRARAAKEDVPTEALLGGRRLFDASRIVIQRAPDTRRLHFAHESPVDPFMLVEPVVDLASRAFLESVRGVLDTAQRFLDGPVADISASRLSQMGLTQPRAFLEVRYPDKTFAVAIGLEGPLHQDLYIEMDGNVYRTGIAVYSVIQVNVEDVRERLLIQTPLDDVRRLALHRRTEGAERKEEVIEIERFGATDFRLLRPLATAADPRAAMALLSFLGGMAADQFLGELNPMPEWDVKIEVESGRGIERITVWKTPQGLIGRQEPRNIEFTIKSADYTNTFAVPVAELRARILVPIAMQDIGRVEIDPGQGQGERIQLQRGLRDAMSLFQPVEVAAEPAPVNELLQASQKLQIVEFVDAPVLAECGLDRGFLTVSLHPRVQQTNATVLHFGRDDGELTFVRRHPEEYVAKVRKAAVDVFRRAWWEYPSRDAGLQVPTDPGEIRYVGNDQDLVLLQRGDTNRWLRHDNGADVTDQATELLELLGTLRGKRTFDAHEASAAAELQAASRIDIRVAARGGHDPRTLLLYDRGREASGRRQAWVRANPTARVIVELGVADTGALLAPVLK